MNKQDWTKRTQGRYIYKAQQSREISIFKNRSAIIHRKQLDKQLSSHLGLQQDIYPEVHGVRIRGLGFELGFFRIQHFYKSRCAIDIITPTFSPHPLSVFDSRHIMRGALKLLLKYCFCYELCIQISVKRRTKLTAVRSLEGKRVFR